MLNNKYYKWPNSGVRDTSGSGTEFGIHLEIYKKKFLSDRLSGYGKGTQINNTLVSRY